MGQYFCSKCGEPAVVLGPLEQRILDMLEKSSHPLLTSEISDRLDNGRGAVMRALQTLEEKGFAKSWNCNPFGLKKSFTWEKVNRQSSRESRAASRS